MMKKVNEMMKDAQALAKEEIKTYVKDLCATFGVAKEKAEKLAQDEADVFSFYDLEDASNEQLSYIKDASDLKEYLLGQRLFVDGLAYCWIKPEDTFSWKEAVEDDVKVSLGLLDAKEACWA